MMQLNPIYKTTILIASLSFFGSIIANSYRPVTNTATMDATAIYKANTPNSSGVYSRVRIGLIAMGIACAMLVPVIKVMTFLANVP